MSYLLDSDVIIDFLYKKDPNNILQKFEGENLSISVITKAEIWYGIVKSTNYKKRSQDFIDLVELLKVSTFAVDEPIIDKYVDLKIYLEKTGQKIADFDLLIAATAIIKNLQLVTRNKRHFSRIPNLRLV